MQSWEEEVTKILEEINLGAAGQNFKLVKEDEKKLKKRIKKFGVEKDESIEASIEKTKKMLDEIYKLYEKGAKQIEKVNSFKANVDKRQSERDQQTNQLKMLQNLHKSFLKKYNEKVDEAKSVEKQEEDKRKSLIEDLQNRIKTVQDDYEAAGKMKIEKYRENQTLKHELSKMEPQLVTTESLFEAQLKKKEIQVQISMTTLKQKIEMMTNFKTMGAETKQKIEKATSTEAKIEPRLKLLNAKEEEHKIQLARAHLVMEEYKNAIIKINGLLSKREKEAMNAKESLKKAENGMKDMQNKLIGLDKQIESNKGQIQMLLTLEENLKKELEA